MAAPQIETDDKRFLQRKKRLPDPDGSDTITVVDLFCGAGGLTLGVLEACRSLQRRMDVRLAVEANADIAQIYGANFSPNTWAGASTVERWFDRAIGHDISPAEAETRNKVGPVHLLLGGPPCQGHSVLNVHTRGNDPKNALYLSMIRAAEVLRPQTLIIENVPAVVRDSTDVVGQAQAALTSLGYDYDTGVLALDQFGVPQTRRRHVLVASRCFKPSLVEMTKTAQHGGARSLYWAIGDLSTTDSERLLDSASSLAPHNLERALWLVANGEFDLPHHLRPECHQTKAGKKYRSMYGRLRWDAPAQTITTAFGSPGCGRYLHPDEPRVLTPHEAARLQFFPDWFDFSSATTRGVLTEAIGNAVPSKMSFILAQYLIQALAKDVRARPVAPRRSTRALGDARPEMPVHALRA